MKREGEQEGEMMGGKRERGALTEKGERARSQEGKRG